jgi:hypothetical protein
LALHPWNSCLHDIPEDVPVEAEVVVHSLSRSPAILAHSTSSCLFLNSVERFLAASPMIERFLTTAS